MTESKENIKEEDFYRIIPQNFSFWWEPLRRLIGNTDKKLQEIIRIEATRNTIALISDGRLLGLKAIIQLEDLELKHPAALGVEKIYRLSLQGSEEDLNSTMVKDYFESEFGNMMAKQSYASFYLDALDPNK